jgi:hypothetical protein
LVHHLQNTRGEFNEPQTTDPGYAQNNTHLRNMEKEAYLLGNMLFRDWEDNKKSKESNTMNESKLKEAVRAMVKETIAKRMQNEKKMPMGPGPDGKKGTDDDKPAFLDQSKKESEEKIRKGREKLGRPGLSSRGLGSVREEDKEELDEKSYGITTSPKHDQSMTGRPVQGKAAAKPKEKATAVGGKLPSGKKGFGGVYADDSEDKDKYKPTTKKVGDKGSTMTTAEPNQRNEADEVDEVEEGTGHATSRLKGQPVPTSKLGKTPAPMATSIARGRDSLKKEYEDKFADIEATSRLHETKQEKLNKLLMEWCKK